MIASSPRGARPRLSIAAVSVACSGSLRPEPSTARQLFIETEGEAQLTVQGVAELSSHTLTQRWQSTDFGTTARGDEVFLVRAREVPLFAIELDVGNRTARFFRADGPPVLGPPLDRFLFARLLADAGRAIVHAAGLVVGGRGVLCGAESGGGKTTLSRAAAAAGLTVLSDERVVAGLDDRGEPTLWGTPWYGEGGFAEPGPAPLARVLFLEKSARNTLVPLTPARAAARLLALSTLPYWNRDATARAVGGVARLLERVPASVLRCTGDRSSVDFVADLLRT